MARKLGRFFWTQKGASSKANQGRIFSATIDMPEGAIPTSRPDVEVVASGLPEPIDLEIDDEAGVLYWTDRGELPLGNTLNCKHLIGDAPASEKALGRQILAQAFGETIGLGLDKVNGVVWVADMVSVHPIAASLLLSRHIPSPWLISSQSGRLWKCDAYAPSNKIKVYEDNTSAFSGLTVVNV